MQPYMGKFFQMNVGYRLEAEEIFCGAKDGADLENPDLSLHQSA
jgi:hypothetical protein